ncbi:MAG: family 78 glycoside hydrolase catalytic domain [Aristaeellaceae bacterium]
MQITHLRAMHMDRPLGAAMAQPVLSWKVCDASGKKQRSARIRIAADADMRRILHDSGEGNPSSLGYTAPITLMPRTRYWWQVSVTADNGEQATSEPSWFETGKQGEPWAGQWIAMPGDGTVHPVMRRTFAAEKAVASARLYICGLGLYEAQLNGQRVSDEFFTPYYDSYDHFIQYQTYDVTALLQADNELSVMLGGGWYMSRYGFGEPGGCLYGERMQLMAELRIAYTDGSEAVIATDESWTCRPAPVTFSSIYDGECYDARLETAGTWQQVELAPPPRGHLTERLSMPVRITEERAPVQLLCTPAHELVLDFGQVITGWVAFRCPLAAGETVHLQYGELLQHDCFYRENLRSAKAEYTYTSAGEGAWVQPHFTFYGFRYVKVEGMTKEQILAAGFVAQAVHSDLERTGMLETGLPKLNRLLENVRWSQRDNFLDIPTDCPQRDERMGWTGDAQVFCPTASYNMETPAFFRKFLTDMRAEQSEHNGAVPHVIPDTIGAIANKHARQGHPDPGKKNYGSCAWADAATVIPWTLYTFYGDKALLQEAYPGMKAWVDWIRTQDETQCGGSRLWDCGFHFADWLALDNPDKKSSFGGTDNTYIATAYYHRSALLTAKAAQALGLTEDAAHYARLAEEVKAAFQRKYYAQGACAIQTQTALALALHWNLVPESGRALAQAQLHAKLQARDMHLDTGFVGTPVLLPALSEGGLHDAAVTLLLQEDYPSWLYEVSMGATTIWERWNSVMPNGLVSDTGMNSMNHYAYGSVMGWMYQYLAGLQPDERVPGFRRVIIAPMPDARLGHIQCSYDSASGRYEVDWQAEAEQVRYRIVVPFDGEAEVHLPGQGPQTLPAGEYRFVGPLNA